jgi:AN1-type zinc finger and ubiquitin domain-containing protein 1
MMEFTPFLLRVETLTGYCFEVVARPIDTVENIKARIAFQEGLSNKQFHLLHDSRELRDDETMGALGFSEGSRVKLVVVLRGGPVATKRVHLPPIGRPITREWLGDDDPDLEDEYNFFGIGMDPDLDLLEPQSGRILIYQNGEKTFLFHVDHVDEKASKSSSTTGDMNDRVKENVNMMRKLHGLKGRMSDQKPPKTPKSTVRRIQAEIQSRSRMYPGQPPYTPQQLAKYVRAKIRLETEAGNRIIPSVLLRPAIIGDRSRPVSGKSRPITARKKKLRCSECKKKLGPTTSFPCRCGLIFCPTHRNSEAHNCSFDYKAEGKRVLKEANPMVVARKIQHF